jgi:hypothetical protein|tara:strand:+ start:254 stop:637 length:384 start_codon:yes stop_codon:yes gene_type:complete
MSQGKDLNALNYINSIKKGTSTDFTNLNKLEAFLNSDIEQNKKQKWNKITKTDKLKKIKKYIEKFKEDNHLTDEESARHNKAIKLLLDKKRLSKINEIKYDDVTGNIIHIQNISFDPETREFTILKN